MDETYQAKVGREQGGNRFFVKEDGYLNFFNQDFSGENLRLLLLSPQTVTNYISSVSVLAASVISPAYGYALFSLAAGCSKASIRLPLAVKGATLVLNFSGLISNAFVSLIASTGVSVTGLFGSNLSCFVLSRAALLKMVCADTGCWSVVESNANVTEQALA